MSKEITAEQLKNKIGTQIGFLLHSGKYEAETIQHLTEIAIDFASSQAPKQVEPDEWISVKKGLPKNYDLVLCYGDPNDGGYHITLCEHCDGIFRFKENGKENKGTITHWKEVFFSPISENRDKGEDETYKMNNGIYGTEMSVSPTNKVTVSDEEIIAKAREEYIKGAPQKSDFIDGAKWMRTLLSPSPDYKIKQQWTREYTKHVIDTINECPVIECNYPNCNCEKQKAIKYTYSDELARCVDCDKVNTTARRNDVPVCAGCCNKRTLKQREEQQSPNRVGRPKDPNHKPVEVKTVSDEQISRIVETVLSADCRLTAKQNLRSLLSTGDKTREGEL